MTESDNAIIHDRENGIEETGFSSGTVQRVSEAYGKIKRGERVDFNKLYNVKERPNYDEYFSQLNKAE